MEDEERGIDPNFFVKFAKMYCQVFKPKKKEEDAILNFAMYIDKELNKKGDKGGEPIII